MDETPQWISQTRCGFALGKPALAGIKGVIRDHDGFIKGAFSSPIGIEDSNFIDILAIKDGCSKNEKDMNLVS